MLLVHSVLIYSKEMQDDRTLDYEKKYLLLSWNELNILIMPILSSTIALTIIRSSNVYCNKTKLILNKIGSRVLYTGTIL
uniref:Uncharacterized protein n=1 Tax=Meloidogyne incognita TaxID=6306 RepID=A0A914L291_MELIC